jgi:hypothetical protein
MAGMAAGGQDLEVRAPPGTFNLRLRFQTSVAIKVAVAEKGSPLPESFECWLPDREADEKFGVQEDRSYVIALRPCAPGNGGAFAYRLAACAGDERYEREPNERASKASSLALGLPMTGKVPPEGPGIIS